MAVVNQPIDLNYKTAKSVAVNTTAGTSQSLGQLSGSIQVRLNNCETVRVGYVFGTKADADNIALGACPTLQSLGTEVITVHPNPDGSPVYWNVVGYTGVANNSTTNPFEVTQGVGY